MRSRAERMSLIKAGLLVGALGVAASAPLGCSDDSGLTNAGFDGGNGGFGAVQDRRQSQVRHRAGEARRHRQLLRRHAVVQ